MQITNMGVYITRSQLQFQHHFFTYDCAVWRMIYCAI